jgi:hypothetical protein
MTFEEWLAAYYEDDNNYDTDPIKEAWEYKQAQIYKWEEVYNKHVTVTRNLLRQKDKTIRNLQKKIVTLFDKIKHGDETHQTWLKQAIEEHFN